MSARARAYPGNAPGSFFVDESCIDCDTCRQLAPLTFHAVDGHSEVRAQPADPGELLRAAQAQLACPTSSIGSHDSSAVRAAVATFPLPIAEGVFDCGFTAAASYGAHSYLVMRADGPWLIDSPRWVPQLVERMAELGGLAGIILTHRDDVADAQRYARHFQATAHIHAADADAAPWATPIAGMEAVTLAPGLRVLPVPGHTAGSVVVLADDRYAFTGDHLWFSRRLGRLHASRPVCWYSWPEQVRSMRRLAAEPFRWVLPGHGQRHQAVSVQAMRADLLALSKIMEGDRE